MLNHTHNHLTIYKHYSYKFYISWVMSISALVSTNLGIINLNNKGRECGRPRSLADCSRAVRRYGAAAAVLGVAELQAFWISVMADRSVPVASRLVASRYYADSVGAFPGRGGKGGPGGGGPVAVSWASAPVDADVVSEPEPEPASVRYPIRQNIGR